MSRNRSKFGVLADQCPERMDKYKAKIHKLQKYKKSLEEKLEIDFSEKRFINSEPTDMCEERIDKFKVLIKEIELEVRELEKQLDISLKDSKAFDRKNVNKKHMSKSEKFKKGRMK